MKFWSCEHIGSHRHNTRRNVHSELLQLRLVHVREALHQNETQAKLTRACSLIPRSRRYPRQPPQTHRIALSALVISNSPFNTHILSNGDTTKPHTHLTSLRQNFIEQRLTIFKSENVNSIKHNPTFIPVHPSPSPTTLHLLPSSPKIPTNISPSALPTVPVPAPNPKPVPGNRNRQN